MGNYFTLNMEENIKHNQDFITEMNTIKIERQIHMRNKMREREFALEIAKQRELFFWYGSFYLTAITWAVIGYKFKKNLSVFKPLVPLTFIMAYQTDLAYGSKLHRILVEAEHILQFEPELVQIPLGVPTAASLDLGRVESEDQKKYHPLLPPL
ncbi:hypothetical protein WA026_019860 [Henosepilachna vigintioctopunctata]|uniref:Plasminogen receptor (KT) n=1 Tax=Henosepilachna vigintioctopunctata TaxID=420089 RepID=A0AAW1VIX3_9CUCU